MCNTACIYKQKYDSIKEHKIINKITHIQNTCVCVYLSLLSHGSKIVKIIIVKHFSFSSRFICSAVGKTYTFYYNGNTFLSLSYLLRLLSVNWEESHLMNIFITFDKYDLFNNEILVVLKSSMELIELKECNYQQMEIVQLNIFKICTFWKPLHYQRCPNHLFDISLCCLLFICFNYY